MTLLPRLALAASLAFLGSSLAASAQTPDQAQPKQVPLAQKDIDGYIAAGPDMDAVVGKDGDGPKPSDLPKLEDVAKKHGFDSYKQMTDVSYTIGIVIDGLDPSTKSYVGPKAVLTTEIQQLKADKSVPAKDKAAQLQELQEQVKTSDQEEKPMPANIDLVKQNYDKLSAASQSD